MAVGKLGVFQPFVIVGSILQTLGVGLYYTFDLSTSLGPIIGYRIIYGVGCGLGIQCAIVVAQTLTPIDDMSITLATVICKIPQQLFICDAAFLTLPTN
jgi:MFS transporter, DHA2 family, glioxin efflux transporter